MTVAERNPNIPGERRMEMEERTHIDEDEANRRFAQKQAKLQEQAGTFAGGPHDKDVQQEELAATVARIKIGNDADTVEAEVVKVAAMDSGSRISHSGDERRKAEK